VALGSAQILTEITTRNITWGGGGVDTPGPFWTPQFLSRPVQGLIYLQFCELGISKSPKRTNYDMALTLTSVIPRNTNTRHTYTHCAVTRTHCSQYTALTGVLHYGLFHDISLLDPDSAEILEARMTVPAEAQKTAGTLHDVVTNADNSQR